MVKRQRILGKDGTPPTTKQLETSLSKENAVTVKRGRYSGVTPAHEQASLPVKISPTQFKELKKSTKLNTANKSTKIIRDGDLDSSTKEIIADTLSDPPPEGIDNASGYAPRPGGFVDTQTGLYIPPPQNAKLNSINKVYQAPKELGGVASKTGEYIPPKDLILDPVKGFIVAKKI